QLRLGKCITERDRREALERKIQFCAGERLGRDENPPDVPGRENAFHASAGHARCAQAELFKAVSELTGARGCAFEITAKGGKVSPAFTGQIIREPCERGLKFRGALCLAVG